MERERESEIDQRSNTHPHLLQVCPMTRRRRCGPREPPSLQNLSQNTKSDSLSFLLSLFFHFLFYRILQGRSLSPDRIMPQYGAGARPASSNTNRPSRTISFSLFLFHSFSSSFTLSLPSFAVEMKLIYSILGKY